MVAEMVGKSKWKVRSLCNLYRQWESQCAVYLVNDGRCIEEHLLL